MRLARSEGLLIVRFAVSLSGRLKNPTHPSILPWTKESMRASSSVIAVLARSNSSEVASFILSKKHSTHPVVRIAPVLAQELVADLSAENPQPIAVFRQERSLEDRPAVLCPAAVADIHLTDVTA